MILLYIIDLFWEGTAGRYLTSNQSADKYYAKPIPLDNIDLTAEDRGIPTLAVVGLRTLVPNRIEISDTKPIKQRSYPAKHIDKELERMLALGVIEKS